MGIFKIFRTIEEHNIAKSIFESDKRIDARFKAEIKVNRQKRMIATLVVVIILFLAIFVFDIFSTLKSSSNGQQYQYHQRVDSIQEQYKTVPLWADPLHEGEWKGS